MQAKVFALITAIAAVTVMGMAGFNAHAANGSRSQAVTPPATIAAPTSQCAAIDSLVANNLATPNDTQAATQSVATSAATTSAQPTTIAAAPTATPAEVASGEAAGGDEALITYQDATRHFAIGYPRSWSQDATFKSGVCFTGRDASIAVQFIPGAVPADLMAFVRAAEAVVQASTPGYKAVYLKVSSALPGAIILGYEWDAGKSTVTEKPIRARTDRYFMVDAANRLVVVSETGPIQQFDPDGVRDTALTYQVTK